MDLKDKFNYVIYHRDCNDGFVSAWVAWTYLNKCKHHIEYHASMPNDKFVPNISGKTILMVDVTFLDKKLMNSIREQSNELFIIDHHTQANTILNTNDKYIHNEQHAAGYLTWQFFYPKKVVPIFIKLVEDADIKGFKYHYTKYFLSALPLLYNMKVDEFESWNNLLILDNVKKVIHMGKNNSKYKEDIIRRNLYGSLMKFEGYTAIVHNFTAVGLWNDVANMLAKKHEKEADFAILWAYEHYKKRYSIRLRSVKKDGVDINEILRKFGAGGHKNAGSFYHKNIFELLTDI